MKKRNPMARDLRTPKYKLRVVLSKKVKFKDKPKHKKDLKRESDS